MNGEQIAMAAGIEQLSNLFRVANEEFQESFAALSMEEGEYEDNSIAPADITEIEIALDPVITVWFQISTPQGVVVYLEPVEGTDRFQHAMSATTREGYCNPDCMCEWCEWMRTYRALAQERGAR